MQRFIGLLRIQRFLVIATALLLSRASASPPQCVNRFAGTGNTGPSGKGLYQSPFVDLAGPMHVRETPGGAVWLSEGIGPDFVRVDATTGMVDYLDWSSSGLPYGCVGPFDFDVAGPGASPAADGVPAVLFIVPCMHCIGSYDDANGLALAAGSPNAAGGFGGDGGRAADARFDSPASLVVSPSRRVYVADMMNSRIRVIDLQSGLIGTFSGNGGLSDCGDGPASATCVPYPTMVALDGSGANLFVAVFGAQIVRRIDLRTNHSATIAGIPGGAGSPCGDASGIVPTSCALGFVACVAVSPTSGLVAFSD